MFCTRCEHDIPDMLWLGKDHPVLVPGQNIEITRTDVMEPPNSVRYTFIVSTMSCAETYQVVKRTKLGDRMKSILELTDENSLEEAVHLALGAASVCWDPMDGSGVFQSERCAKIGEELVEYIRARVYTITQRMV